MAKRVTRMKIKWQEKKNRWKPFVTLFFCPTIRCECDWACVWCHHVQFCRNAFDIDRTKFYYMKSVAFSIVKYKQDTLTQISFIDYSTKPKPHSVLANELKSICLPSKET